MATGVDLYRAAPGAELYLSVLLLENPNSVPMTRFRRRTLKATDIGREQAAGMGDQKGSRIFPLCAGLMNGRKSFACVQAESVANTSAFVGPAAVCFTLEFYG